MDNSPDIKKGIDVILSTIPDVPNMPGIYKMLSLSKEILYIGKAKELPKRLIQYTAIERMPNRLRLMVSLLREIEFLTTKTEAEALLLEATMIRSIKPKFNIALKDDKSFPYIVIEDDHNFPRLSKYRGLKKTSHEYYGPFADVYSLEQTIIELQKIFKVRSCSNNYFASRTRPCLLYQIKRCSGPCVNKIEQAEYANQVQQMKSFLSGKSKEVQNKLAAIMEEASKNLEYEKAAEVRDKIKLLTRAQTKNIFINLTAKNIDIFACYFNAGHCCIQVFFIRNELNYGNHPYFLEIDEPNHFESISSFLMQFYQQHILPDEIWINTDKEQLNLLSSALNQINMYKNSVKILSPKQNSSALELMSFGVENAKTALEKYLQHKLKQQNILQEVQKLFYLNNPPSRIEVYDNSHIQGQFAVGCMIVACPEGFLKKEYRVFKIRELNNHSGGDDYAMLNEVLTRRLNKLSAQNYPDLMIIDGGKGHLSIADAIMKKYGIDSIKIVCMAKGIKRNAGLEFFFMKNQQPFQLAHGSNTLHYLQTLRDEAHRFAITTHRKLRAKDTFKSMVDNIPGIGPKRKKILLTIFGSYEVIKAAGINDLAQIKGIGKKFALKLYNYLHEIKHI